MHKIQFCKNTFRFCKDTKYEDLKIKLRANSISLCRPSIYHLNTYYLYYFHLQGYRDNYPQLLCVHAERSGLSLFASCDLFSLRKVQTSLAN